MKESLASKLMMWRLGSAARRRRGYVASSLYGPNAGGRATRRTSDLPSTAGSTRSPRHARFARAHQALPADGEIVVAMRRGGSTRRILTDMWYPQVVGLPPRNQQRQLLDVHRHRHTKESAEEPERSITTWGLACRSEVDIHRRRRARIVIVGVESGLKLTFWLVAGGFVSRGSSRRA